MRPFAKRGGEPVPVDPILVTPQDLKSRMSAIKVEVQELAREREANSLAALQGFEPAKAAIQSIDKRRQQLMAEQETVESALRELQQQKREGKNSDDWARNLPRYQHRLVSSLRDGGWWDLESRLARSLASQNLSELRSILDEASDVEHRVARELVSNGTPPARAFFMAGDAAEEAAAREEQRRLEAVRQNLISERTDSLLSSVELVRPPDLVRLIGEANARLEARSR